MAQFSLKKTHVRLLVKDPTCFLFPNSTFSKIMPYTTGKLSISSGKLSNSLSYKKKKKKSRRIFISMDTFWISLFHDYWLPVSSMIHSSLADIWWCYSIVRLFLKYTELLYFGGPWYMLLSRLDMSGLFSLSIS